ncbi:MAG: PQQ-binding-like beta-propeller repeat protein [Bacteroidia bacterium]|nr:PQQ-binding-like beta-propeller repeat protein [Bacteroidia bacterium]
MRYLYLGLILSLAACQSSHPAESFSREWPVYHGSATGLQYSPLDQITPANVHQLQVAWTYASGDASPSGRTQIQCNPIVVDGTLYGSSPALHIFALEAATGTLRWEFDPFAGGEEAEALGNNRGVTYWTDHTEARILFTANEWLYALDARTGKPVLTFGQQGRVSLKDDLGRDAQDLFVISNTPGIVYRDLLILGTRVSESAGAAPGFVRAYDIRTGAIAWVFHTIPQPGEYGYETWPPDAWKRAGGVNCWAGMSLDSTRGTVYIPTGSASFDFWGGDRQGDNLFANCIMALDAATGTRKWHFQTVHHDLWDRDLPAPPDLVTITHQGTRRDVVVQITKSGFVFVLDRDTGEPVFPVEEQPVPASDLQGEQAAPTQPVPVRPAPFARQTFTEADITDISPEAHAYVASRLAHTRTGVRFIPPSREGTVIFPGFDGGGEWGGAACDPETGWYYVNANEMPWILTMISTQAGAGQATAGEQLYRTYCAACHGAERQGDPAGVYPSLVNIAARKQPGEVHRIIAQGKGVMPSFGQLNPDQRAAIVAFLLGTEKTEASDPTTGNTPVVPYAHTGYNRFLDPDGYPAVRPPWGTLTALNLHTGETAWQVPLGEYPELTARGIPKTGTENYGGPVVTAGGLVFIGASRDGYFRAFDKQTGAEVWKYQLPAGAYATPAVYEADRRQYVVVACGGGKMGTPSGDAYIAFALPR